jgi:hypothetical protein
MVLLSMLPVVLLTLTRLLLLLLLSLLLLLMLCCRLGVSAVTVFWLRIGGIVFC